MNRWRIPNLVVALALALLLPLEQAHCACMGMSKPTPPAKASCATGHACCAAAAAAAGGHHASAKKPAQECLCRQLPTGTLPQVVLTTTESLPVTSLATLTAPTVIAPASIYTEVALALDVGSSPLPDDPGAHGLRAPPASA